MTSKAVGDALEDLVALLHQVPAGSVETRVRVPTLRRVPGGEDEREIDVLISQDVAGYPIRIAFECKNYKNPVGVELIDAFLGKLEDVGIPQPQGIFVSPAGYTSGARGRAEAAGLRLLVMEGLNTERLAAAVNDALLSIVLYGLFVESFSEFPFLPGGGNEEPWPDGKAINYRTVHDEVWQRWVRGTFPTRLGQHTVFLRDQQESRGVVVDCRIAAYVGNVSGTVRQLGLRNVSSSKLERVRLETDFKIPNTVDLRVFTEEDQLSAFHDLARAEAPLVLHRIRVPRIIAGVVFWPPSKEAVQKVVALRNAGIEVTFASVEGRDLSAAWAHFESERDRPPSSR